MSCVFVYMCSGFRQQKILLKDLSYGQRTTRTTHHLSHSHTEYPARGSHTQFPENDDDDGGDGEAPSTPAAKEGREEEKVPATAMPPAPLKAACGVVTVTSGAWFV